MNLAGCSPFLLDLWMKGHNFEKSFSILSDPMAVVVMYAAAAVGYLIDWAMVGLIENILYQKGLARQKSIKKTQGDLIERWGPEVTGDVALDEYGFAVEPNDKNARKPSGSKK